MPTTYPELTGRLYKHRPGSIIHKVLVFTLEIAQLTRITSEGMCMQKKLRNQTDFLPRDNLDGVKSYKSKLN